MGVQESDTRTMKISTIASMILMFSIPVAHAQQWDEVVQRWPDGKPQMVNTLNGDGRDVTIIKRKAYFASGRIQMEMELKNGLPHGHFDRYYENGNKQIEGNVRDGKLHGHQTVWYESGQKKGEGEYVDDLQMPGWTHWDEEGAGPVIRK